MFSVKWIVVVAVAALLGLALLAPLTVAHDEEDDDKFKGKFKGDLTMATPEGPPFGGADVGSFKIKWKGNELEIEVEVDISAPSGYVLEGWLVDPPPRGGTGYKLSLGLLEDGELEFEQTLVNPFTYSFLVITMEPIGDPNPNAGPPVAGADLGFDPFGQN